MTHPNSYTLQISKATWGDGPWQDEPDHARWDDPATGYKCRITRHPEWGHLCGYVSLPENHPLYGQGLDYLPTFGGLVHGGLTWAENRYPDDGVFAESRWVLGFDCGHAWDTMPGLAASLRFIMPKGHKVVAGVGTYRTIQYVTNEVTALAQQLAALAHEHEEHA